jgi:hypothetical protein
MDKKLGTAFILGAAAAVALIISLGAGGDVQIVETANKVKNLDDKAVGRLMSAAATELGVSAANVQSVTVRRMSRTEPEVRGEKGELIKEAVVIEHGLLEAQVVETTTGTDYLVREAASGKIQLLDASK